LQQHHHQQQQTTNRRVWPHLLTSCLSRVASSTSFPSYCHNTSSGNGGGSRHHLHSSGGARPHPRYGYYGYQAGSSAGLEALTMHGTTILCVRKGAKVVMMGDGQVSQGSTVVKPNAKKASPHVVVVVVVWWMMWCVMYYHGRGGGVYVIQGGGLVLLCRLVDGLID
jgi:hypothetical protein